MKFKESALAHKYLDGLIGLEIGGAAHNPFGLNTKNVDLYPEADSVYRKTQIGLCGEAMPVDIVASGNAIPLPDKSVDFIISSHVIEHFYDPIAALNEWARLARKFIFIIVPHRQRTFDKGKELTHFLTLYNRYLKISSEKSDSDQHWSVWEPSNFLELCQKCGLNVIELQEPDDKVGNGFTVVIQLPTV